MVKTSLTYLSVGDSAGVGASAHYLKFDRYGILLDAGANPQKTGLEAIPPYEVLQDQPVNGILITHAHFDHIGSLPVAIQHFPGARIYMTPATTELTYQLLFHFLQVQRKREGSDVQLFYDENYLESINYLYQSFEYGCPFPLHSNEDSGLRFTFYDAGHILGSAGVLIEWRGKRIFYSPQFLLKGAQYPEPPIDLLITESTYGANAEAEKVRRNAEMKRFANHISACLKFGGVALLPVFALGRTQEMIALIHHLRVKNRIPVAPIYITGMGLKINKAYDRMLHKIYPEYIAGTLRGMTFGRWRSGQKLRGPAILLATSGMMLPGTASFDFARTLAENPRNAIFFVGYADPETPGGLFRAQKYDALTQLFGVEQISAKIEIFQFSAHSNRRELLAMIRQLRPKNVVFSHGEPAALAWMANQTQKILPKSRLLTPDGAKSYPFYI